MLWQSLPQLIKFSISMVFGIKCLVHTPQLPDKEILRLSSKFDRCSEKWSSGGQSPFPWTETNWMNLPPEPPTGTSSQPGTPQSLGSCPNLNSTGSSSSSAAANKGAVLCLSQWEY